MYNTFQRELPVNICRKDIVSRVNREERRHNHNKENIARDNMHINQLLTS